MRTLSSSWLLMVGFLAACATSSPVVHEGIEAPEVVDSWEEGCEDARSLVLLCREDGDECGFFSCREVAPREVLLASRGGGPLYIPGASPCGPGGGLWNEAWREFKRQNPRAPPAEIYRHAGALLFRFELTGPIVPYYRRR